MTARKTLFFLMSVFCMIAGITAASAINVTTTAGGQLQGKVEAQGDAGNVTELTINGPINGTDIDYLHSSLFNLTALDLSNASIVAGGDSYHRWEVWDETPYMNEWADPYNSENNVVGPYMFNNMPKLTSLTLPSGITAISENAFSYSGITAITIPAGVTVLSDEAFRNCGLLKQVILPAGLTTIGTSAFYECGTLESINLPSTIESIGDAAFYFCVNLTTPLVFPSACKSIGFRAFYNNCKLSSVTFNEGLESIGNEAFANCTSIEQTILPESITSLGEYAFCGCTSLTSFTFPSNIKDVPSAVLSNCDNLTSVTLANGTTIIGYSAFSNCPNLSSINLDQPSIETIYNGAFSNTGFTTVTLPNTITSIDGSVFSGCSQLTSVNIPTSIDYVPYSFVENCPLLTTVTMHDGIRAVQDWAFNGCTSLSSICLNDDINYIGSYAFRDCQSLVLTKLPDALTQIGEWALAGTQNITGTITIPTGVTAIGSDAFNGCGISRIVLHEGITEIGTGVFANTPNLNSIELPSTITRIPNSLFENATGLKQFTFSSAVTEIGESAFKGSGLTSIQLPEAIQAIESYAFANTPLRTFSVPDGFTSRLGYYCLQECKQLKTVYMGRNQDYTENYGFDYLYGCDSLELLRIHAGTPPMCEEWIMPYIANCVLEVPEDMVSLYQQTDVWKDFKLVRGFFSGDVLADADFAVMQQLYNALDGANWTTPWDMTNNHHAVGKWNGITTAKKDSENNTYAITDIDLSNQKLKGSLPAVLFTLPALKTLNLSNNAITGNLSTILSDLPAELAPLTELYLTDNKLTGDIYPFASKFTGLTHLELSYNRLTDISQPIVNDQLYDFGYGYQFMEESTHSIVEDLPDDAPITDITVGVPTEITFNHLVTYSYYNQDYSFTSYDLGRLSWTGGWYYPWEISWTFYQTDGQWNLYDQDSDNVLKAQKNKPELFVLAGNEGQTILLRLNWIDGDVNADQTVDITDLQSTVYYALNGHKPNGQMFNFSAADANNDSTLDVRDIIGCVDYILSYDETNPSHARALYNKVRTEGNNLMSITNGSLSLRNTEAVAAIQLFVSGASSRSLNIAPDIRNNFSVSMRDVAGGVRIVVYSATGHELAPGQYNIVTNLPAEAAITDARMSDNNARYLGVSIEAVATGIQSTDNGQGIMTSDDIIDLQGRKVCNPQQGIYIVNGQKVIIK
ncbi:MAG: leucine-rich repeat protein [Bacteroidaceae bacterium]|nr:leucine-rich repeat protein [Bacteroidaceae bacterium]